MLLFYSIFSIIALLLVTAIVLWILLTAISFVQAAKGGAFYVSTSREAIRYILQQLEPKAGKKLIDLGSGDGRVVRIAAREFALQAEGYEIGWWPYLTTLFRNMWWFQKRPDIKNKVTFFRIPAVAADVKKADYVFLYTGPEFNNQISPKLRNELPTGAKIVSLVFPLPGWDAIKEGEYNEIKYWVYQK